MDIDSLLLTDKEIKGVVGESWKAFPLSVFNILLQAQLDKIKRAGHLHTEETFPPWGD